MQHDWRGNDEPVPANRAAPAFSSIVRWCPLPIASRPAALNNTKRYLDLLELCLCGLIYHDPPRGHGGGSGFHLDIRTEGKDWPSVAHTMIGRVRLSHLRRAVEQVLAEGIPGDFIEAGVWRGGACIMMRAVLAAYGVSDRRVHLADSFRGLPVPDVANYPSDKGLDFSIYEELAISRHDVEEAFRRYELLDDQVRFHEGWFKDSLPALSNETFALIRLDGDLYESTWTSLVELYPRLSPGGFAIIDDYHCIAACKEAVDAYRHQFGISAPLMDVDWNSAFWRKPALTHSAGPAYGAGKLTLLRQRIARRIKRLLPH
jgi:O-methyltransferase